MEIKLADLEKENSKYLRKDVDGGILTEKYEIDRYKLEQYSEVVNNLMLGNYNEFGEYIIQDEIKEELRKCRKVIEDNYENILFVRTENTINAFSYINFAVKVINSDKLGYKTAILELLEPIYKAKGYIENTQATVIAKINLPNNDIFKDEVYKAYNIVIDNTGGKKELKDEDEEFKNLIMRKIQLLYVKQHTQAQEDYMICYKKNVEELQKTEKGKEALKEYEKQEKIVKKYLNLDENDYKSKNEILTQSIEKIYKSTPNNILDNLIKLEKAVANKIINTSKKLEKPKEKERIKKPENKRKQLFDILNDAEKNKKKKNQFSSLFEDELTK